MTHRYHHHALILLLLLFCRQGLRAQLPAAEGSGVSLRTNLLFDAAVIPNVGVEWGVGSRWSMLANGMYIWLKNDSRHRYWRWAVADVEVRRWLVPRNVPSASRRMGVHVGPYAAVYRYDVEFGGEGQRSDFNWGVGLAAGYQYPIGRRWSLDFTLSIGYIDGKYKKYSHGEKGYMWEADYRRRYFGPTKAEVALVWDIGGGSKAASAQPKLKQPKLKQPKLKQPKQGRAPRLKKGGLGW